MRAEECYARARERILCGRKGGHTGPHRAYCDDTCYYQWEGTLWEPELKLVPKYQTIEDET